LHITGYRRPFTAKAAEALLQQYGAIKLFWMNNIKSMAYVIVCSVVTSSHAARYLSLSLTRSLARLS